jgi:predicted Mrr-cat superfamily restriction endonuclease
MTVWLLYQSLKPEEEVKLRQQPYVALPLADVPDLSRVMNLADCRRLLQAIHPDAPPETINRLADRVWKYYSEVHPGDIIAVLLRSREEIALAEVTGKYEYRMGENREDIHTMPVKWHEKTAPMRVLKKLKLSSDEQGSRLVEITHRDGKIALMDHLPYKYNRFSKWKWVIAILVGIHAVSFIIHLIKR